MFRSFEVVNHLKRWTLQKVEPSVRGGEPARPEAEQGGPMIVFNTMLAGIFRLVVGHDEAAAARLRAAPINQTFFTWP